VETLGSRIAREGALKEVDAVGWIIRLAKSLEPIHALRVAHGSVTAEAIKIEAPAFNSKGYLIDARHLHDQVAYHSPERADGESISPANDTWAVTVTLYLALTGSLPFPGADDRDVKKRILGPPASPLAVFDVGDEGLQRIIDRAFSRDLPNRLTSLRALREALEAWHPDPNAKHAPPLDDEGEDSRTSRPRVESPRSEQPRPEQPRPESPRLESPRSERPRLEGPRSERPRSERPGTLPPGLLNPLGHSPAATPMRASRLSARSTLVPLPKAVPPPKVSPKTIPPNNNVLTPPPSPVSPQTAPNHGMMEDDEGVTMVRAPSSAAQFLEALGVSNTAAAPASAPSAPASQGAAPRPQEGYHEDFPTVMMSNPNRSALIALTVDRPTSPMPPLSPRTARAAGLPVDDPPTAPNALPSSPQSKPAPQLESLLAADDDDESPVPPPAAKVALPVVLPADPPLPAANAQRAAHGAAARPAPEPLPFTGSAAKAKGGSWKGVLIGLAVLVASGAGAFFGFREQVNSLLGAPATSASSMAAPEPSASASPGASSSASGSPSVAAPASASVSATASTSAAADSAAPSASSSAAASGNVNACMMPFFVPDTFIDIRPNLDSVCKFTDPRDGAMGVRTEIVRGGKRRGVSEGMREWAVLGFYEIAAFAIFQAACCPSPPEIHIPVAIPTCDIETPLKELAKVASSADADDAKVQAAVDDYARAIKCVARVGAYDSFGQKAGPQGGQDVAFDKVLKRVRASLKK
jgi:eukaryotic-like serine/threonine-protein kinase